MVSERVEPILSAYQAWNRGEPGPVAGETPVVRVHLDGSGRRSGIEVSRDEFHVFTFSGEILRSFRAFRSESEALSVTDA